VTKPVRALFELVRMHRVFDIYNTREEALKAYQV
jgi:anti-sigma B factor antagonist